MGWISKHSNKIYFQEERAIHFISQGESNRRDPVKQKLVLGIPDSSLIREEKFGERNLKETIYVVAEM